MPLRLVLLVLGCSAAAQNPEKHVEDREVLRKAVSLVRTMEPGTAMNKTLVHLAQAQARCGDREAAITNLDLVDRQNDEIKSETFRSFGVGELAIARAGIGDIEGAKTQIAKARELAPKLKEPIDRITLLQMTAEALEQLGEFSTAKEMLKNLITSSPMSLAERVRSVGVVEDTMTSVDLLEVASLYRAGKPDEAREKIGPLISRFKRASRAGKADGWCLELADYQAEFGDFEGARKTAERLVGEGEPEYSKARVFNRIADNQMLRGDRAGASESAKTALKIATTTKFDSPMLSKNDIHGYSDRMPKVVSRAIEILAESAGRDEAEKLATSLEAPHLKFASLLSMAEIRSREGKKDAAKALFERAEAEISKIPLAPYKRQLPAKLAFAQARAGLLDDIEGFITKTETKEPDGYYLEFVRALSEGGHWKRAEVLLPAIQRPDLRARARASIALELAKAGQPDQSLELARTSSTAFEKYQCLINLADGIHQRVAAAEWKAKLARTP